MSLRAKVYTFVATVAVLSGAGYAFHHYYELDGFTPKARAESKDTKDAKKDEQITPIEVETAELGAISARVRSTANLRALRDVVLKAQLQGVVREVLVEEGAFVEKGQQLARLDDRELVINLELARQKLEQTRVQLETAKVLQQKNVTQIAAKQAELKRNEEALSEGLVSDTEVAMLRNQLAEIEHDERAQETRVRENGYRVEELEAEIEKVQVQISNTRILAPFAGRITERTVELGQTVGNADSLFRLASFSPLFAEVHLSEQDSHRVRAGQEARVSLGAAGEEYAMGRVIRISPVVDNSTGTVKVTAELRPSDSSFRPGAFVRVEIETDLREGTVLIPKRSVIEEDGKTYVFVTADDIATRREVELGYADGAAVEVLSGITAGERIVVAGQGNLKDGDKTRTVEG